MPSQEPIHLFVCGTLTDPACVVSLTDKQFVGIHATLDRFERVESPLRYPFIPPRSGAVVHGFLLHDIDPVSLAYHMDERDITPRL